MTTPQQREAELIARCTEDAVFREEFLKHPKEVFERETGMPLPEDMNVKVIEETPNTHYVVLPNSDWEGMSAEELAAVAGGRAATAKRGRAPKMGAGMKASGKNIASGACHDYLCCSGTLDISGSGVDC